MELLNAQKSLDLIRKMRNIRNKRKWLGGENVQMKWRRWSTETCLHTELVEVEGISRNQERRYKQFFSFLKTKAKKMSWQDYVDKQLVGTGLVKSAAIIGLDGAIWAKSTDLDLSATESKTFATNYSNAAHFQANGVVLAKTKFVFLSGTETVLRGKKNKEGIHCVKTNTAIIVAIYQEPATPQEVANVVEKLGDYLVQYGS